ncbi:MAG: hypothetical protein ACKVRP_10880 [Bacteroidota bacterium]
MADPKHDHTTDDSIKRRHETSDADFKNLMFTGIGLLGVMAAGFVISFFAYRVFTAYSENPGAQPGTFANEEEVSNLSIPRLQASPHDTLLMMRKAEDSVLTSYGWADKDSGWARVPIERAKQLTLEDGLPQREGNEQ